jgi:hypothetical protein
MTLSEPTLEKTCLNCGEKLGPGRKDRKYCSDPCKTEYNNKESERKRDEKKLQNQEQVTQQEMTVPEYILKIQDILLRNREILSAACKEDKKAMKLRDLEGRGFNKKFFTSEADPTSDGHIYRFCFEYGYWRKSETDVMIVHRPREVDLG